MRADVFLYSRGFAKSRNRPALANDSKSYQSVANDSEAKQNEALNALGITRED